MAEKNVHGKLNANRLLIGTRVRGEVQTKRQGRGVTSLFGTCLGFIVFGVVSFGYASEAIAESVEAGNGTISPIVGAAAPLLDAPVALTDDQRARAEKAIQRSNLPVPLAAASGEPMVEPASPQSAIAEDAADYVEPGPNAPGDFVIFQNSELAPASSSEVNEPSVAQANNVVFYTGNWYAAVSTNHGATFSYINPYSGPFAPVNGGFCCDQVTIYAPSRNVIFYLQQYIFDGTSGTHRINVDSNADGTFDCAYDLTPQDFGRPNGEWLDYPDLVLGANSLYHTSNIFNAADHFTSSVIARYSLDEMAACGSIGFSYLTSTNVGGLRPTHGAGTTMYWGAHLTTASLRIYEWAEGSGTILYYDRAVSAWVNGGSVCPGPDGNDFTAFGDGRILGSYKSAGVIGFMWRSAQHGGFPLPYVQIARFDEGTKTLIDEPAIWSSSVCWSYPSVGVNAAGELGGTILAGSATSSMQCQAWIADSVNGGTLAPLENLTVTAGTKGPAGNRSGDYLTARGHQNNAMNTWTGSCFAYQSAGTRPRFAWWGRESNGPGPDSYEPDNSSGVANTISSGSPQNHSINPVGDEDWVTFTLNSSAEVILGTSGTSGDTRMWLYDSGLNLVEFNDDGGAGLFSLIDRQCGVDELPAGTYYVKVDEYGNDQTIDSYSIQLATSPCIDSDGDGVFDNIDNCTLVPNPTQCDGDGDGYGNHCDADFNNDGIVNNFDVGPFKAGLGTTNPVTDLNCDGITNNFDVGPFKSMLGSAPGPSGLAP